MTAIADHAKESIVLVVEDDGDTRRFLSVLLLSNGYRVVATANGAEALAEMRSTRPAVILLHLMMSAVSGVDFRRQQMADPVLSQIPVICISGAAGAQELASSLGMECHPKPIDVERLVERIDRYCD